MVGIHTKNRLIKIPAGGVQQIEERMARMQEEIDALKSALEGKLDAGRVTDSTSVTEAGWAVDARQANASISGTFASVLNSIDYELNIKKNILYVYSVMICNLVDYLITTGIPAPRTYCNIEISQVDFYGSRSLTREEISNIEVVKIPGSFYLLIRNNKDLVEMLKQGRILVVSYTFN